MGRQKNRQRQRRVERRQETRRQQPPARSTGLHFNRAGVALGTLVVLAAIALFIYGATQNSTKTASKPTATPIPTTVAALAPSVNGVQCNSSENLAYHIHQHITLYDHGKQVPLPYNIGIPSSNVQCYYWIHVHQSTPGIIHIESPTKKIYRLGTFFGIWKATKNDAAPTGDAFVLKLEAAAKTGQVTTYVNGKLWPGSYTTVPLKSRADITVEIGKPIVAPKAYTSWGNL